MGGGDGLCDGSGARKRAAIPTSGPGRRSQIRVAILTGPGPLGPGRVPTSRSLSTGSPQVHPDASSSWATDAQREHHGR